MYRQNLLYMNHSPEAASPFPDCAYQYSSSKILHKFTDSIMSKSSLSDVSSKKKGWFSQISMEAEIIMPHKSCIPTRVLFRLSTWKDDSPVPKKFKVCIPKKATSQKLYPSFIAQKNDTSHAFISEVPPPIFAGVQEMYCEDVH